MKKLVTIFCIAALSIVFYSPAFGADDNKGALNTRQPAQRVSQPLMDKNIAFISGSISKIDTAATESIKVEVLNDVDGKTHIVELGTGTNILKVIEAGELKAGDKARVVAKKTGDKEIALSIVTGKLKEMRMPRPSAPIIPAPMTKKNPDKK